MPPRRKRPSPAARSLTTSLCLKVSPPQEMQRSPHGSKVPETAVSILRQQAGLLLTLTRKSRCNSQRALLSTMERKPSSKSRCRSRSQTVCLMMRGPNSVNVPQAKTPRVSRPTRAVVCQTKPLCVMTKTVLPITPPVFRSLVRRLAWKSTHAQIANRPSQWWLALMVRRRCSTQLRPKIAPISSSPAVLSRIKFTCLKV